LARARGAGARKGVARIDEKKREKLGALPSRGRDCLACKKRNS